MALRTSTTVLATLLLACLASAGLVQAADPPNRNTRLGLNLNSTNDWTAEIPFVDIFKTSRKWNNWNAAGLDLDANGWVKSLQPGQQAFAYMFTDLGSHVPRGSYVILYDGVGAIQLSGAASVISSAPGRIVATITGMFTLTITATTPGNYLRNIRVIMPGFESTYRTQIFNPAFLDVVKTYNTMRFMDWMATNNSTVSTWAQRPTLEQSTWAENGGVPLEIMIALCNRIGANPWFCMPHLATDDYMTRFASMVRDNLDPSLRPYVEYSNEVWNSIFDQAQWAVAQGRAAGLSGNDYEAQLRHYSRRSVRMFDLWTAAYGGNGRFVRVMGSHAANSWASEQALNFENAKAKTDALAIAPYFTMMVGSASQATSVTQVINYLQNSAIPQATTWMNDSKAVADAAGVRLIAYEAGQHAVGVNGMENNDAVTGILTSANRDPRMNQLYQTYLSNWKTASGNDLICLFASVAPFSKWGSWGMQEYLDQGPDVSPKLAGVIAWRATHPDGNQAPVLSLGGNRTAAVGASISLAPTITDDGLSHMPVLTSWTASNPAVAFANPASATTTVSASVSGTYTLTLTASDGMAASSSSITFTVGGGGGGGSPAFVLSATSRSVPEGDMATFTVRLSAAPAATTTVTVSRTAGDGDISVSAGSSLVFTTANWNTAQTVTLSAAEDADAANGAATITVASSGLASLTVAASEVDDDTVGLVLSATSRSVPEGDTATFTVRLSAAPAATTTVTVSRTAGDGDISVSAGSSLVFTTANWNTAQTVTLSGAEDTDTANGVATITVASAGLASRTVAATEVDDDTVGLVLSATSRSVPEGGTATVTVRLSAAPAANTTVTVSRTSGDGDISVSAGSSLVFTTANWNTAQTVTLSAAEDADSANGAATITVASTGLASRTVAATEVDDDTVSLVLSATSRSVSEGGTATVTVRLSVAPAATTTVTVSRTSGDGDISVSAGSSLAFTTANWNTAQTVTLSAAQDADTANGVATVTVASTGLASKSVAVTEADDDAAGADGGRDSGGGNGGGSCGAGSLVACLVALVCCGFRRERRSLT